VHQTPWLPIRILVLGCLLDVLGNGGKRLAAVERRLHPQQGIVIFWPTTFVRTLYRSGVHELFVVGVPDLLLVFCLFLYVVVLR
jgi:hypothetical protein